MQWFVYEHSGVQVEGGHFTRTEKIIGLYVRISRFTSSMDALFDIDIYVYPFRGEEEKYD